jgi:ferritin-like metal-binding protein YciE
MKLETLNDLLVKNMIDLYDAEKQITKALPKMIKTATSEDLRAGFEEHLEQTQNHIIRLEDAFKELGMKAKGKKSEGMKALIDEGKLLMSEKGMEDSVMDAALIMAAQHVEHYEIAAYGTACAHAEALGLDRVFELLNETLEEEEETDEKLSDLAETAVNEAAALESEESEEEE